MDGAAVIGLVINVGVMLVLLVPGVAALFVKVRGRPGGRAGRAGERAAEIVDVFDPGQRRQVEQMEISDSLRVDAESADGDPLGCLPDPDGVRDQLDPEHLYEARRARTAEPQRNDEDPVTAGSRRQRSRPREDLRKPHRAGARTPRRGTPGA